MGCNGANHSLDCDCGWGGVYHANSGDLTQALAWPMAAGSWINPNAHCPVCNASVFFYKSPTGGKVYFDALGAPWPKHPCVSSAIEAPSSVNEVPDSVYWRARDYFLLWQRKLVTRAGLKVLGLSNKKFTEWMIEETFLRSLKNCKYSPIVALWVLCLPHAVLGEMNFNLEQIKKTTLIEMAKRIQDYFEKWPPRGTEKKACQRIAQLVLDKYGVGNDVVKVKPV